MAVFSMLGPFIGPGEEPTAKVLTEQLPADWVVISGLQIPTQNREDVDFLVIGENRIFLVEEKFWGPRIVLGDPHWYVGKEPRNSPVNSISHKAKVLQSYLKVNFPNAAFVVQKPTVGIVVLSNPQLVLHEDGTATQERVFRLDETAEQLLALDSERSSDLHKVRNSVIEKLSGFPASSTEITRIGAFDILGKGRKQGNITKFDAEHEITGAKAILTCFQLEIGRDSSQEFKREILALRNLSDLQRTWKTELPFPFEAKHWLVSAALVPPGARNLAEISTETKNDERQQRRGNDAVEELNNQNSLSDSESSQIVMDAFAALSDVHSNGVIHRALSPNRIWLGKGRRVMFSDFSYSRIESVNTLHIKDISETGMSPRYVAPEVRSDVHAASQASDVFSLALILADWLHDFDEDSELTTVRAKLTLDGQMGQSLIAALNDSPKHRPSAANMIERLKEASEVSEDVDQTPQTHQGPDIESEPSQFFDGNQINKYAILRKLAEGQDSTTWLARDTVENDKLVVVKQFLSDSKFLSAQESTGVVGLVNHERVQRLISTFQDPTPGFSVNQHFDGQTLPQRNERAPLEVSQFRKIAADSFRLLSEAFHAKGLIHGDLSPSNLLVDAEDEVYLIDIELCTQIGSPTRGYTRAYASPEALSVGATATISMDIYGLAATFISIMLNRTPYESRVSGGQSDHNVRPLSDEEIAQWGPDGVALLKVLFGCVSADAHRRPSDALDISRRLLRARGLSPDQQPLVGAEDLTNSNVDNVRRLYVNSRLGNSGMLALGSNFALDTYVPTQLDRGLMPKIAAGDYDFVILTGNPGDGKTSFLQKFGSQLLSDGGSYLEENIAGWKIISEGKSFAAIFDASESFDSVSSDARIANALTPPKGVNSHTLLVAMNDGRLAQFVDTNGEDFPALEDAYENFLASGQAINDRIAIIDMKQRSLIDGKGGGLVSEITKSISAGALWEDANCSDCASSGQCPIFRNVKKLRDTASEGLTELMTMSHLAAGRRATVRDFRSAIAWLITGDLSCGDVHDARKMDESLILDPNFEIWNLAFENNANDKLLSEWRGFDPSKAIPPIISRKLLEMRLEEAEMYADDERVGQLARQAFWGEFFDSGFKPRDFNLYKHFSTVLNYLSTGENSADLLSNLIIGISKLVGAHGFDEPQLAVAEQSLTPDWSIIKIIDADNFVLDSPINNGQFELLEYLRDSIHLRFVPNGNVFTIGLDTAEIILRSTDGEIFGDLQSDAIRGSVTSFANRMLVEDKKSAVLISPVGIAQRVELQGNEIKVELN